MGATLSSEHLYNSTVALLWINVNNYTTSGLQLASFTRV